MNKVKSNDFSPRDVEGQEGHNEKSHSTVTYVCTYNVDRNYFLCVTVFIFLSLSLYFRTPLMLAAKQVVQLLVDPGAQVDCTDKNYRTALHRAVSDMEVNQLGLGYLKATIISGYLI